MRLFGAQSRWVAHARATEDKKIKAGLAFTGAASLLELVDRLGRRPRRYGSDTVLPLIYLVRSPDTGSDPLDGIENRLTQSRGKRIPFARVSGAECPTNPVGEVELTIKIIDAAAGALSAKFRNGRRLAFPRYGLARWLWAQVGQEKPRVEPDRVWASVDQRIRDYVRGRYPAADRGRRGIEGIQSIPWPVHALAWLPLMALLLMRTVWRPLRWLVRYRLADIDGFSRLVYRLTGLTSAELENEGWADQFRALLVAAFLVDIRSAYRRTTLFGVGRRRTAYPVLIVDGIEAGSVGLELLRQLDMAQQATDGRPSPLLVVAAGTADARLVTGADDAIYSAESPETAYSTWRAAVHRSGSFVLPMTLPDLNSSHDGHLDRLWRIGVPSGRQPATPLLIAALLAGLLVPLHDSWQACWTRPWDSGFKRVDGQLGHQCVGLAPRGFRFFDNPIDGLGETLRHELDHVEGLILDANRQARERPGYATVVFLGSLSPTDTEGYRTELEELRGFAALQGSRLNTRPIEIRLANSGAGMSHAVYTAKAIVDEARSDPRLVAVVGLGISKVETRDAIRELAGGADAGVRIPMVGTLLSATSIANTTSYYHQVAPTNERQAELVAGFASSVVKATKAHIYYSGDPGDLYSQDLKEQAEIAFEKEEIGFEARPYRTSEDHDGAEIVQLGQHACEPGQKPDVIFYAGRADRFASFLESLTSACADPPRIIADDDVTGFVLDDKLRPYGDLKLNYVSFASSLAWGPNCSDALRTFSDAYDQLFGKGSSCRNTKDSHAIVSYDGLLVVIRGIDNAGLSPNHLPSRDSVHNGIEKIQPGSVPLIGASGQMVFLSGRSAPHDKAILMMLATGNTAPTVDMLCGTLVDDGAQVGRFLCPQPS